MPATSSPSKLHRRPARKARTLHAPVRDLREENLWVAKWAAAGINIRHTDRPVAS